MRLGLRKKALSASPEVIQALRDRRANFITRLGGTNQRVEAAFERAVSANYSWMYANSPAVRTVVDLIARNIAQLDLRLYEEMAQDEREAKPDAPAAYSLRYPNATLSSDQFVWAMVANFLVFDNAYATKHRSGRPDDPIQLVVLPPQRVEVAGRGIAPEGYRVQQQDGRWFPEEGWIPPADMIHWRGWNSQDPRIGISRLETLRAVIAEEAAIQTALVELVKSGLAEPAWVGRPMDAPEWSAEARERFEEDLANRLKRSGSKPPVLEEGMELKGFGVSPRNAQMLEVRKYALQQVASIYGVPLGMVGLGEPVEEAQAEFYADTLPPYCEEFCRQLNLSVLQQEYDETGMYFEFDLDEKVMSDDRLKALTSAAGVPILLRNEARAKLNLPQVDGGDEPITPLNVMVGDNPKPSPQVMPIQNPLKPSQEGDHREEVAAAAEPERKALEPPAGPDREALEAILSRLFARQLQKARSAPDHRLRHPQWKRWERELAEDLEEVGFGDPDRCARFAREVMRSSRKALAAGDGEEAFSEPRAKALAERGVWLAADEHPSIRNPEKLERLESLRRIGLPDEVLWEMAGFNEDEIDRMRSLGSTRDLLAATHAGEPAEPSDH